VGQNVHHIISAGFFLAGKNLSLPVKSGLSRFKPAKTWFKLAGPWRCLLLSCYYHSM